MFFNRKTNQKRISFILIFLLISGGFSSLTAQTTGSAETFGKIQLMTPSGERMSETQVRLRFSPDALHIESESDKETLKTFRYAEVKDAEYSYSKTPRWKTGLGLGAASIAFPPLFLVALTVGFTKHRRHWLTIKTETDYAVLKLSKSNRRFVIPALETRAGLVVKANGEDK